MQILVDADALPNAIKELLCRTVERLQIPMTLVANQNVRVDESEFIRSISVPEGSDAADNRIVELVQPGDLVVTADIPLADRVVTRGAYAINPRGELYTAENIKDRLALRDLLDGLRNGGILSGGPPPFTWKDRQAFANRLDRILTRNYKS
ncbi:MAG: YaiI/YqxD family protein [Deltaproteobacteria bacterium]|nr:YaiI/YqxD family protein [Deltaproteobacteria bacterium]